MSRTNRLYKDELDEIRKNGTFIEGAVCDGHKGLLESFGDIPVQMCQFHQIQIERRLLTQNPHLIAGIELFMLCKSMTGDTQDEFRTEFDCWCESGNLSLMNGPYCQTEGRFIRTEG